MNSTWCIRAAFIVFALLGLAGCAENAGAPSTASPTAAAAKPAAPVAWAGVFLFPIEIDPTPISDGATHADRIDYVVPDSPASTAGLQAGDLILSMNGKPTAISEVGQTITATPPNTTVPVVLLRGGGRMTLDVQLGERPANYLSLENDALVAAIQQEHRAADASETAGDTQAAFDHYVRGLQHALLHSWAFNANIEQMWTSDVTHLAALLPKLRQPPVTPSEANRRNRRALAILKDASSDTDNDRAASELWFAIYEAPWIADLYLNRGLVLGKAGYPDAGAINFRRYLVLNPGAADRDSVQNKIAELEVLADEQKPWQRFAGQRDMPNGGKEAVGLRHDQLFITAVTEPPNARYKAGDVLCRGTFHGTQFNGKCLWRPDPTGENREAQARCLGASTEYNARGTIQGDTLTVDYYAPTLFHTQSCTIDPGDWKWLMFRTYSAASRAR